MVKNKFMNGARIIYTKPILKPLFIICDYFF